VGIVKGQNGEVDLSCVSELLLFCNYANEKQGPFAAELLRALGQLHSID